EVLSAVQGTVDNLLNKINDAISFYNSAGSEDKIYHCFVTGGSLQLPGIFEGLSSILDLSIEVLDPVRRVDIKSRKISDGALEYLTYSGAVTIGLALRNFDK